VPVVLELLSDVRWRGQPVAGDRARMLLAALAYDGGRSVQQERLIELVWGEEEPANSAKGLQVLVSRTRSAVGGEAIVRDGGGYRLGVEPAEVDSIRLSELVRKAKAALEHDAASAAEAASAALELGAGLQALTDSEVSPLQELRSTAVEELAAAGVILAQARSRTGAHSEALPALEQAWAQDGSIESLLADLLHSEAVVHGPAAALERYEQYRRDLRERMGSNPGERLQSIQRELLALDQPVRSGVRYDPTTLLGRDGDLERLRGLMRGSRVVSIVGPGGLGKTRLAHVLARDPALPVSHVVELVGVTSPEDVVAEVGAVLGVRDSVSTRRTLTPAQRADLRARVAQRLAQSPSLLVLDNCEHLVEVVAELTAFLVSSTPEVRILTTSRAPLAIAAERVYMLGELDVDAATELFRARAVSARPQVQLEDPVIESIVTRLDGLPLAIELAAAKVRAMSVQEIDRRLENRFALLRGGDRSAPDRHQTLLAVIDWSWNLLNADEQRALRWLALFHDGFTLDAADQMLGVGALDAVEGLVDQSLLSVQDTTMGVRYRMLETVREFGQMQLIDAGEDAAARGARRRWALGFARDNGARLAGREQVAVIDALHAEEVNLADELRDAVSDSDRESLVVLLAALGSFWSIRGEHGRLMVLADAVTQALKGWRPPPEAEDSMRMALTVVLSNATMAAPTYRHPIHEMLHELGPGDGGDPRLIAGVRVMLAHYPSDAEGLTEALQTLSKDPDRYTARAASQWLSHILENAADTTGALEASEAALALIDEHDGPWHEAILRYQLSQLMVQVGRIDDATPHARAALKVMQRIGARDDELQLHALLGLAATVEGRLEEAEAELDAMDRVDADSRIFAGLAFRSIGRAELALVRGQTQEALEIYRECAAYMRGLSFPGVAPNGNDPWALFGESCALAAHAYYARGADEAHGWALFDACRTSCLRVVRDADAFIDLPVMGMQLFALGVWGLLRDATSLESALRLLVLADRLAYARMIPTLDWERIAPVATERAPGRLEEIRSEYHGRKPVELLDDARVAVEQLIG
jgi:predicted ATPase/DNA-binding SARP family transcriptional activator/tetratricopeptide (TPR) repeat protein